MLYNGAVMPRPACRLIYASDSPLLAQLFTGYVMLADAGRLTLSAERTTRALPLKPPNLANPNSTCWVIVNNRSTLFYDTHDCAEIDTQAAARSHLYFKRSYNATLVPVHFQDKVRPLGLNYAVYPDRIGLSEISWKYLFSPDGGRRTADSGPVADSLQPPRTESCRPRISETEALPDMKQPPRVLFLTRAWNPHVEGELPRDRVEDRMTLNLSRARCIELLREKFRDHFLGGFAPSRYAVERFPSLVLPAGVVSRKHYLAAVRRHQICVITSGLRGSTGWKMGEYVAASRAIVAEQLNCSVPGGFASPQNYLEFSTPEECVQAVERLFRDRELRTEIMIRSCRKITLPKTGDFVYCYYDRSRTDCRRPPEVRNSRFHYG